MAKKFNGADDGVLGECVFSGRYGTKIFEIDINTDAKAREYGKARGRYTTLNCSRAFCTSAPARKYLENRLFCILDKYINARGTVLVVGLGNAFLVADSLGAGVVKGLFATHNIPSALRDDLGDLCALIPGVSGINGFGTFDVVSGVVKTLKPDIVIIVDALTARNPNRIGCSFQFSDTGISPGGGVGNKNKPLNRDTLGVPVVAIGVPMMINAAEFGYDKDDFLAVPKEIDFYASSCARVLSRAINLVVHGKNYKNYL